jgi:hypothetical protein
MTQSNENGNGSRLDRIEALMLEMATASVRHDNAISRHDEEFSRINATIERNQEANRQSITALQNTVAGLAAGQQLNQQAIANLTASIQELRNLVADYIQGRLQT